jgi:hypothetical protein
MTSVLLSLRQLHLVLCWQEARIAVMKLYKRSAHNTCYLGHVDQAVYATNLLHLHDRASNEDCDRLAVQQSSVVCGICTPV